MQWILLALEKCSSYGIIFESLDKTVAVYVHNIPANIHLDEDVLKMSFVVFRRRFDQDEYICLGHTSSRSFQDVLKMSSRCLQDIFKTSCKDVFKTFSRRIIRLNCLPKPRIYLGDTFEKFMVSVENLQE